MEVKKQATNKEPKHFVLHKSIKKLEKLVDKYSSLVNEIETGGSIPQGIDDNAAKELSPSFLTILNDAPDRIDIVGKKLDEILCRLYKILF